VCGVCTRCVCSVLCCNVALHYGLGMTFVYSVCVALLCVVRCVLWWLMSVRSVHAVHVLCVVL